MAAAALVRVSSWKVDAKAWKSPRRGVLRVYRRGRRALSRAAENRAAPDLHEWRKQAKYLWGACKILGRASPAFGKKRTKRLHELWSVLGDDHDLAVLRQTLAALLADDPTAAKALEAIDARRDELQKSAFELGRLLYKKRPRAFVRKLGLPTYGTERVDPLASARPGASASGSIASASGSMRDGCTR
jgi:hypothetical protein